jgi:hypothetical protein
MHSYGMGLSELSEYEVNDLLKPALFWLRNTTETQLAGFARELEKCFDGWKRTMAGADGIVEIDRPNGLLRNFDGAEECVR